jgi:transcriptional regulator with XRE-family HTH domain
MGQAPRRLTPQESALHLFGAELRRWRMKRGLSQAQLSAKTHYSSHTIGKIEIAARRPTDELARLLDDVLDTGGVLTRLMELLSPNGPGSKRAPQTQIVDGWPQSPADTVDAVTNLWTADLRRRSVITAVWAAAAVAEPLRRWLSDPVDDDAGKAGQHRVGQADVDVLWTMCTAFADADHQLGGGYARDTLMHYAGATVTPLLRSSYTDHIGRQLFAAAARLCDVAGFMCFDSGRPGQGLAQKYFLSALRMAKISGDLALGAHILTDLSMQAQYLQHTAEALSLAEAAVTTAGRSGSPSTRARCHAIHARALAQSGDRAASGQAIAQADRALDRTDGDIEPTWIKFFTRQQLATEAIYASAELGDIRQVQTHADIALDPIGGMNRRQVLAATTVAGSYLPSTGRNPRLADIDVERACQVLNGITPVLGSLTSARALTAISTIRSQLEPLSTMACVQRVEHDLQHALAAP